VHSDSPSASGLSSLMAFPVPHMLSREAQTSLGFRGKGSVQTPMSSHNANSGEL
jgi:hypothetical protein